MKVFVIKGGKCVEKRFPAKWLGHPSQQQLQLSVCDNWQLCRNVGTFIFI